MACSGAWVALSLLPAALFAADHGAAGGPLHPLGASPEPLQSSAYIQRRRPALVPLHDGRLLVAGGGVAQIQSFDPATGRWSDGGMLQHPMEAAHGIEVAPGRVLLVARAPDGGIVCEGLDGAAGAALCIGFPETPHGIGGDAPLINRLSDGRVLVAIDGAYGLLFDGERWSSVMFEPGPVTLDGAPLFTFAAPKPMAEEDGAQAQAAETVDATGYVPGAEEGELPVALRDGRVLRLRYNTEVRGFRPLLWDPASGKWTIGQTSMARPADGALAATLDGCAVAFTAAEIGSATPPPDVFTVVDASTLAPVVVPQLVGVRDAHMVLLADGRTLVIAGTGAGGRGGFEVFDAGCTGVTRKLPAAPIETTNGLRRLRPEEMDPREERYPIDSDLDASFSDLFPWVTSVSVGLLLLGAGMYLRRSCR